MSRAPQGVIKPLRWDEDRFVIIPREFAQDHSISPFTKAVLLDVQSRSENYETNAGTIMRNYGVGRDKARSVLSEGQKAGFAYAHEERSEKGRISPTTFHISTCKRSLREFVIKNGWETADSYDARFSEKDNQALKNQGLEIQGLDNQSLVNHGLETEGNERRDLTKGENNENIAQRAAPDTCGGDLFSKAEPLAKQAAALTANEGVERGKPKRKPAAKGSAEFEDAWEVYRKASSRSPGSKTKALAQFMRLAPADRARVIPAIKAYAADCAKQQFGRGDHRHMADMNRFFADYFAQFASELAATEDPAKLEQRQVQAVAMDLADGERPNKIVAFGWRSFADVPHQLYKAAFDYAKREFLWHPSSAFALQAAA